MPNPKFQALADASLPKIDSTITAPLWDGYIASICERLDITDPNLREQIDCHELMHLALGRGNGEAAVLLFVRYGIDLSAHFGL